jgi:hypothetical protein
VTPEVISYIAAFFSGAFLCNCVPHLAAGLQGRRFPTPLARIRRKRDSSAFANFIWGTINVLSGTTLILHHPLAIGLNTTFLVFAAGWLLLGTYISFYFGRSDSER